VVGRIALRHDLNANLKEFGGHIGYEVRPSCRKKGFAKEMLKQLLQTPKALEIRSLLLTCAPTNLASNKTILANGGILTKTAFVEKWKRETNYYLITL
jgi:predicted acetyltransferase